MAAPTDLTEVFAQPPSYRLPLLIGASVLGALILAVTTLNVVEWWFFRPQAVVTAYFEALADRDGAEAADLITGEDRPTLDAAALKSDDYTPPSQVRIDSVSIDDGRTATAQVGFTLDGEHQAVTITLVRDQNRTAGLFPRWRITDGTYPISVFARGVQYVLIAGVTVPIADEGEGAWARVFPGDYVARLPQQPLLVATPVTMRAPAVGEEPGEEIASTVAPDVQEQVERQVRVYVDECARKTTLQIDGCPFSDPSYVYREVRDVRWRIIDYPSLSVELARYGPGAVEVQTLGPGQVEVTWTETYLGTASSEDAQFSFHVEGEVVASGETVTFIPSSGE